MAYGVPSIAKTYRSVLAAFTKVEVDGAVRALANVAGQLPARPIVTWGGQTGSERVANLRVVDANDTAATGTFLVLVWVSASEGECARRHPNARRHQGRRGEGDRDRARACARDGSGRRGPGRGIGRGRIAVDRRERDRRSVGRDRSVDVSTDIQIIPDERIDALERVGGQSTASRVEPRTSSCPASTSARFGCRRFHRHEQDPQNPAPVVPLVRARVGATTTGLGMTFKPRTWASPSRALAA